VFDWEAVDALPVYHHAQARNSEDIMNLAVQVQERGDPAAALEPLMRLVRDEMAEVNAIILSQARSDVALIPELAQHLINSGGKRLRPMLTIGAAKMCGYGGDGHIKLAASVEFMHTATLLHDDVVDESDMRRGKKTARMLWGNQASVLVGDFLLGQAFRMMVDVGSLGALKILSEASAVIAEGEVMQLAASKNMATTEEQYLSVILAKTAALFSAAAEIGAVITNRSAEEQAALRLYGTNIGLAFQLIDDALDYSGEAARLGKRVGDDFREGKITLPVVLSYRRGSQDERAFWRRTLQDGAIEDGDLEEAIALMYRHNVIEETIERACLYGKEAREALHIFPKSEARNALLQAIEFSISRLH
jgi:octaprenyl-diphosphate synthase